MAKSSLGIYNMQKSQVEKKAVHWKSHSRSSTHGILDTARRILDIELNAHELVCRPFFLKIQQPKRI